MKVAAADEKRKDMRRKRRKREAARKDKDPVQVDFSAAMCWFSVSVVLALVLGSGLSFSLFSPSTPFFSFSV